MSPVLWILAVVGCIVIGREIGKWLFGKNTKLHAAKRAAQTLSIKLREFGMKLIPSLLDDLVVGDAYDMIERIRDLSKVVQAGNDAIIKELEATYDRVLAVKLSTPEGRAVLKAKLAEAEKVAVEIAKAAAPAVAAAAIAAL
jgi:hypothetical protein